MGREISETPLRPFAGRIPKRQFLGFGFAAAAEATSISREFAVVSKRKL